MAVSESIRLQAIGQPSISTTRDQSRFFYIPNTLAKYKLHSYVVSYMMPPVLLYVVLIKRPGSDSSFSFSLTWQEISFAFSLCLTFM